MGNIDCIQLAIASIFKTCEMGNQGGKEIARKNDLGKLLQFICHPILKFKLIF